MEAGVCSIEGSGVRERSGKAGWGVGVVFFMLDVLVGTGKMFGRVMVEDVGVMVGAENVTSGV